MAFDPYSQAPAFGHVGAGGNVLDSAEPPVDPYTGQRGDLEYRMTPRPVTATSYNQLPTKESEGSARLPAVKRVRDAITGAWTDANAMTPEYQEKMNKAVDPFGNPWPGMLNRNVINPALNTAAAIPAAIGAGVGATAEELATGAGRPGLGRDFNAAVASLSPM